MGETRARAAAILERAYDQTGAAMRQAEVLEVLIATTAARDDRLALYGRLADVHAGKLGDANGAFDVIARAAGEFPSDLPLWDRLAGAREPTPGRAQDFAAVLVAAVPEQGPTGLSERVELDSGGARGEPLRREARRRRSRDALSRADARASAGQREGVPPAQADPHDARAVGRARRALRARRRGHGRRHAAGGAPHRGGARRRGDHRRPAEGHRVLRADPRARPGARAGRAVARHAVRRRAAVGPARAAPRAPPPERGGRREARSGPAPRDAALHAARGRVRRPHVPRAGAPRAARAPRRRASSSRRSSTCRSSARARPSCSRAVYASRDEVPELVRVLEIHLEFATPGRRAARSAPPRGRSARRAAARRRRRARSVRAAACPSTPTTRARASGCSRSRGVSGAHERAAGVLTTTAAAAARAGSARRDPDGRRAPLRERPRRLGARRGGVPPGPAARSGRRVDRACPRAGRSSASTRAATASSCATILRIEVRLEDSSDARRELLGRLGELCETVLDDPRGAIEAWRVRLDDDPSDAQALSALDRLYERTQSWPELVEVLRAREQPDRRARRAPRADGADRADARRQAGGRALPRSSRTARSSTTSGPIARRSRRWRRSTSSPTAGKTWPTRSRPISALAEAPADKLQILARLGEVRQVKLGDVASAIGAYRQALEIDPSHERCRSALEAMLGDDAARLEAAEILHPLYEADGLHEKLLRVLEIEAENADSISAKLATIAQAVKVAEGPLGDPARALSYAARGLARGGGRPGAAAVDSSASSGSRPSTGKHAELVELLRSAVADIVDGDLQLEVTLRIAEIARSPLGQTRAREGVLREGARAPRRRPTRARGPRVALRGDGRSRRAARRGQAARRGRGHRSRSASSSSSSRRSSATRSSATRAPRSAVYEQILEMALDAKAIEALERLYAQAERWPDLIGALRAADHRAGDVQRAAGGAAPRARDGAREADRRGRSRVRRVRRGARHRSEASADGRLPRGADGAARARGARRRDARAGLPRAPRLAARHDDARGAPRRQSGPGRAPAAPAPPLEAARGAGGGLQGRARDDRAPPRGGRDRRGDVGRARAARARRERRGTSGRRLRGRAREDRVRRAGDGPAREAHRRALRGAEERRPRPRVLPARARVRPRGEERELRGDRSPAARSRSARPSG